MKITVISSTVFKVGGYGGMSLGGYGGLESVAWQSAKGLAARKHEVTLIAPDNSECPGCTVIPIGPAGQVSEKDAYAGFRERGTALQAIRKAHPGYWQNLLEADVVLDHSWQKHSYLLKEEGRLKCPVLGILHAPVQTMLNRPPPVPKPCIVCISEDQRQHYEALFSQPAKVCYNGVCPHSYKSTEVPRTDRYLFLARFSSVKSPDLNQEIALQAGVGLDMIGDTTITHEPELLAKCKARADGKQIRLIGGVSRGETIHWFSQAKGLLHVCPQFREPFGLSPVEAQLAGCPVIGFDLGAVRETIENGKTGFVVKSIEEAIELVKTDAISSIDRKYCRERAVALFSEDKMVSRYEELCLEAIHTGGW